MRLRILIFSLMVSSVLLLYPCHAICRMGVASDLTPRCSFTVSSNSEKTERLHDGRHDTAWTSDESDGQYVQIELPDEAQAAGVYIMWDDVPQQWSLLESSGDSIWKYADIKGKESFVNTYIPLNGATEKIRIESDSYKWKLSIAEIRIFGSGSLPDDVQVWQEPPAKADLMVVAAHPDDELIYFGGTLPYYAGQLGKHTVVVYMTSSPMIRKFEALDGLWKVGVREYPVFLPLANEYTSEIKDAEDVWGGLDSTVSLLVEQVRRFKPDVVVTHDLNGEYGHGAHKLTALAVEKAVDAGSHETEYPASAVDYGVWQVKKCYLHLFDKHKIEMDWNIPLSFFGGKTALDMAQEGYALHVSQHFRDRPILDSGEYDNAAFGLYFTSVGPDAYGGDFFENIVIPTDTPEPTPASVVISAVPTLAPVNTPGCTAADSAIPALQRSRFRVSSFILAVLLALLSIAGLLVVQDKKKLSSSRHTDKKE